jgi:hypothetical protein
MFGPPLPHEIPSRLPNVHWDLMQQWRITGDSQFPQLRLLFATSPHKHLQNTSTCVIGNILIGFSEGVGQGLHFCFEPVQDTSDGPAHIWELKALPAKLTNGFFQLSAKAMQFCVKLLAKSLILIMLNLLFFQSCKCRFQVPVIPAVVV